MDFFLFIISIILLSVGSFLDKYTTSIFIKDLGIEFEANKHVRNVISKYGYKIEILREAFLIILFGIIDSLEIFNSFFFCGFVFLITRGLIATHNLQSIFEYRTIGINKYKEQKQLRTQELQHASLMNRIKMRTLLSLVEAFVCLVIYGILLVVDFPLIILVRSLVFGLVYFYITTAYYSLPK